MSQPARFTLDPRLTVVASSAFIARGAILVGDVQVGEEASVWFGCVLRGDVAPLRIGARVNLQEGTIVHADPGFPVEIGDGVTVGHRCVVHGAKIGAGSLIGMGAILLNGVNVGPDCLVGAGALLVPGQDYTAPGQLILGSPAKVARPLRPEERENLTASTLDYVAKARAMREAGWQDASWL